MSADKQVGKLAGFGAGIFVAGLGGMIYGIDSLCGGLMGVGGYIVISVVLDVIRGE